MRQRRQQSGHGRLDEFFYERSAQQDSQEDRGRSGQQAETVATTVAGKVTEGGRDVICRRPRGDRYSRLCRRH